MTLARLFHGDGKLHCRTVEICEKVDWYDERMQKRP